MDDDIARKENTMGAILIADDNPENLKVLTDILETKGYNTRVAKNGEQALESIYAEAPDLVFLDIQMPKMDGYEVCRRIKSDPAYKIIPVIFISAMMEPYNKKLAFEAGGDDYMTKPFQTEEILARVSTHLKVYAYQKQTEEKLRKSEQNYQEIYNASSEAIFIHNPDTGEILDVNKTMLDMFGYTYNEALNLELGDIGSGTPEYSHSEALKKLKASVQAGPQVFEWHARRKDGSKFWIEVALRNTNIGGEGLVLATVRNITKRKIIDDELQLVRHSIEYGAYPFLWVQKDSSFFYVNHAICNLLGYSQDQLCSMCVSDIDPDYNPDMWPGFWEVLKSRKTMVFKTIQIAKNGEKIPVEVMANFLEFKNSEHVFAYVKDIREIQKYEQEKDLLSNQLQQAQKMEAIGTLAGGIAHDFNNILGMIIGYAEIAKLDVTNTKKIPGYLNKILTAGNRAKELVQQILTFSRQTKKEIKPLKVKLIVKEVLKLIRSSLPVTIEVESSIRSDAFIMGDPTQVHQVVLNLCTNAAHAMRGDGGKLTVHLIDEKIDSDVIANYPHLSSGNYLKLSVKDTGHGISPDIKERLFDPFFTTKKQGEGTGLGLAVVHGIVKNLNGEIVVESTLGSGSCFSVLLPVVENIDNDETIEEEPSVQTGANILLIDDEPTLVDIGKTLLEQMGFDVTARTSSIEALALFKAKPDKFDLVLTDFTMPEMTGDRLTKKILSIRNDIPIILCTGFSTEISKRNIQEIGAKGFLLKPIIKSELLNLINDLLDVKNN